MVTGRKKQSPDVITKANKISEKYNGGNKNIYASTVKSSMSKLNKIEQQAKRQQPHLSNISKAPTPAITIKKPTAKESVSGTKEQPFQRNCNS